VPNYVGPTVASAEGQGSLKFAILAACSTPVLLTELPNRPNHNGLLGFCFVQGWMGDVVFREQLGCDDLREFWDAMAGSDMLKIF
jgi:hypothetical protein